VQTVWNLLEGIYSYYYEQVAVPRAVVFENRDENCEKCALKFIPISYLSTVDIIVMPLKTHK
jgi:hypothetical protein